MGINRRRRRVRHKKRWEARQRVYRCGFLLGFGLIVLFCWCFCFFPVATISIPDHCFFPLLWRFPKGSGRQGKVESYCCNDIWAAPSEFVSSSIPSWQILTAHAQPFSGARDLAFCLKVPLDSLLIWASSDGSGETARMRRLAWTFAARIGDKYQIRLTRSICAVPKPSRSRDWDELKWGCTSKEKLHYHEMTRMFYVKLLNYNNGRWTWSTMLRAGSANDVYTQWCYWD